MAATHPPTALGDAGVAAAPTPPERSSRPGFALLLALLAACLYAAFAHGATSIGDAAWLQAGLAIVGITAVAAAAGERGIVLRARGAGLYGLALLVAFAGWCGLTLLWSVAPDESWLEFNRGLAYALVVALGLTVGTSIPRPLERVATGWLVVAVAVAAYAILGKTLPGVAVGGVFDLDHGEGLARLHEPLGYWNALGLLCALAAPVALRIATDETRAARARLPAVAGLLVLLVALGLTYSRGGIVALAVATAVLMALGPARGRTLGTLGLAALAAAVPLGFAFARDALSDDGVPLDERTGPGLVLLLLLLAACAVLLGTVWALWRAEARGAWTPDRIRFGWWLAGGLAVLALLAGMTAMATSERGFGGTVSHAVDAFTGTQGGLDLTPERLTATDSGNRWGWWEEAVGSWGDRPVGGWGAGSFGVIHLQYRTDTLETGEALSVPLTWLTETGLVGLLLACGGLGVLFWTGLSRVRALPRLVASRERDAGIALVAAAAAWGAHALFDYDWDIPGVTVPVLLFLGVLAGGAAPRTRDLGGATAVFVDPERGARVSGVRTTAVAAAALAACAIVASAVLPSWSQGRADDAADVALSAAPTPAALQSAAADADLAARLDPLATRPLIVGAQVAALRNRGLEARDLLLEAVDRQPDDVAAWMALARTARDLADRQGFERAALRALDLDPQGVATRELAAAAVAYAAPSNGSATAGGTPLTPAKVPAG